MAVAPDADHPTRTLWGDMCLDAVAYEGSRLIRPKGGCCGWGVRYFNTRTPGCAACVTPPPKRIYSCFLVPFSFLFRSFCPIVFRLFHASPSSLFFSLLRCPWWRIVLFCYFVSVIHAPRAACEPSSLRIPLVCCLLAFLIFIIVCCLLAFLIFTSFYFIFFS